MFADAPFYQTCNTRNSIAEQFIPEMRVSTYAHHLFDRANRAGWISRLFGAAQLKDISEGANGQISNRYSNGVQVVQIDDIRGSEGRCKEFDAQFHPLQAHSRFRWERVATARDEGIELPAVDLIQIGKDYFVRDGHHRISVARARGEKAIEANITVWEMN